jgi:hypothetical protein
MPLFSAHSNIHHVCLPARPSVSNYPQLEESIRDKDERYRAIKDGEKALKRMTESITEVISKTKMELTVSNSLSSLSFFLTDWTVCLSCFQCQMDRLNSKDMLTADNVMTKVHEHNDTILFPRLKNRFVSSPDDEPLSPGSTTTLDNAVSGEKKEKEESKSEEEEQQQREEGEEGGQRQEEDKEGKAPPAAASGLASTLPAPSSCSSPSKSRPGTGTGRLSKTASAASRPRPALRPKSPTASIGIKLLSKSKINETLGMMRVGQSVCISLCVSVCVCV